LADIGSTIVLRITENKRKRGAAEPVELVATCSCLLDRDNTLPDNPRLDNFFHSPATFARNAGRTTPSRMHVKPLLVRCWRESSVLLRQPSESIRNLMTFSCFNLSPRPTPRSFAVLFGVIVAASLGAAEMTYMGPLAAGKLEAPPKQESSGLAMSRHAADILWTHDDSGGAPVLYAIDKTGKKRGSVRVSGVKNEDWEDLASFQKDGKAWLLIADTGDNDAERDTVRLHLIEEPAVSRLNPAKDVEVTPAYSLRIRYEDGARDCESVAVDVMEGAVYLLTKRDSPARLYRVALAASREKQVTAKFLGTVPELAGNSPIDSLFKHVAGKRAAWPTGFDITADGRTAVVLTYAGPVVFARAGNETWTDAFKREPTRLLFHGLPQAEGVCFSSDARSIYVVSETTPAMVRYDREER
jgi:hypothetical protein